MKRNFKSINEEINRMKSLFDEGRLYGNIEEKKVVITEQYRFFSNIADAFKVTLKSFDQLETFTKFINREINDVDDIIKHVDDFEEMWPIVSKNLNIVKLKNNLNKLKKLIELDKLKTLSEEQIKVALKGFPSEGGMQEMVFDMWAKSVGLSNNLPQKVDTRIVKVDPKTGAMVVGTKNEKGVIVFKNEKGETVLIEKGTEDINTEPDTNMKSDDESNLKPEYEDVEYVDVVENTNLRNLDGKVIDGTKDNIENFNKSIIEMAKEAEKNGLEFTFSISTKNVEGGEKNIVVNNVINNSKTVDEVSDETTNRIIKEEEQKGKDVTPEEKVKIRSKVYNLYRKLFGEWGTKYILNPTTFMPGVGNAGVFKFEAFPDANNWTQRRGWQIVFRSLIYTPLTAEAIYALGDDWFKGEGAPNRKILDTDNLKNNIVSHYIDDVTYWAGKQKVAKEVKNLTLDAIEKTIKNLSNGKIQPVVIKQNINTKIDEDMKNLILDENGNFDETKCPSLEKDNKEIIANMFKNSSDLELAKTIETLQKQGYDSRQISDLETTIKNYFGELYDLNYIDNESYVNIINSARKRCQEFQEEIKKIEQESETFKTDTFNVVIEGNGEIEL